jgi:predicted RNase H-like HicB family nuclease
MKYAVIIERGLENFGAYVPDLPGCVAVSKSSEEVVQLIREAIELHIQGMKEDGLSVPLPSSSVKYIEAAA